MDLTLLREERIRRGVTQEKLAKSLGFKDKSSYCLIENGKTSVSVEIANKIAVNLGLPKDILYKIFFAPEVQESSTDNIITHEGE
ncbi:XRE family transcriptional regulator [bacterium 1XD8-76]|nr:XRE family transcriptional regulator [bacterium 1XD8-76]